MNPFIEKLARTGLTQEQLQRAQQRAEGLLKAAEGNLALQKELLEKMGFSPWGAMKSVGGTAGKMFGPALGQTMALAGAGAALTGGTMAARKAYEVTAGKLGKAKAYRDMVEARPELKDRDQKAVQRAFDSLYKFNPDYAKDPLVAGSFVDSVSSSERLDIGTVNALVSARKSLAPMPFDPSRYTPSHGIFAAEEHPEKMEQYGRQAAEHKEKMKQYDRQQAEHPEKMKQYRRQAAGEKRDIETHQMRMEEFPEKILQYDRQAEEHKAKLKEYAAKRKDLGYKATEHRWKTEDRPYRRAHRPMDPSVP